MYNSAMQWVALVGPELEENLSLRYLASSLAAAAFRAEIVVFNSEHDFAPALAQVLDAEAPPLLVGISLAFQWRAHDFLAFAVALRELGYRGHITLGGHFATFATAEILSDFPEVDSICRQEAEGTIVALARAVSCGAAVAGIPGIATRSGDGRIVTAGEALLPDLATLPWPDRRGEPASCFGHRIAPLVGSRGCYANCSFCCIAAWHEQSLPGKRYRLREVDAIADEMLALQQQRGIDIFVFHDDNFFLPGHQKNRERIAALADALDERGIGPFATVVKARPTDVDDEVFDLLKYRLRCIRVYVGVESDADQGLATLRRWSASKQNHRAIELVRRLDLYTCFNLLLFDPDTDLDALETNIRFMQFAAEFPSNFGRVELYAGTPLLARMLAERRCRGDWMQWDYSLSSEAVERVFDIAVRCFYPRNFGDGAIANRLMGTRFDVEVCRHFHPEIFRAEWLAAGKRLTTRLSLDSAAALTRIVARVRSRRDDDALVDELAPALRRVDDEVAAGARDLAREMQSAVGRGRPLTDTGDQVATPLQSARDASGRLRALALEGAAHE